MNVLTNLMALLTPKTAKDAAQTQAAGQAAGGADFAALMETPAPGAAVAAMPGAPVALPVIGDGAADPAQDAAAAGALPLPHQTAAVLAQQIALPAAGAKAIRNATVSAGAEPAGGKALPVVDHDPAEGGESQSESMGESDAERDGVSAIALTMPAADGQAAVAVSGAAAPVASPAPAPLPKQGQDGASVDGVATVAGGRNGAKNGSVNIADIKSNGGIAANNRAAAGVSGAFDQFGVQVGAQSGVQPGALSGTTSGAPSGAAALAAAGPRAAGQLAGPNGAPHGRDRVATDASGAAATASPLPSPAAQSAAAQMSTVAGTAPPVAVPLRLAGRASVTAARAEAPDMPVATPAAPATPAVSAQPGDAAAAIPQAIVQAAGGQPATVVAQAAAKDAPAAPLPAMETDAPAIGEATALLRMAAAAPAEKRGATPGVPAYDAPKGSAKAEAAPHAAEVRPAEQAASADRPLPTVHAMQASLASAFPTVTAGTQPATDLSATLGQQVIDMSSGGQWIDGLAKEIATLASGTGQGSFRLSPEHLGPMRVDIRHGDLGAEISLTVQTAAAESALRQDSDRLKADAQLSAVRVHEVRVERVHNVAETARSDGAGNQNGGNNNGGASSWNQGGTQAAFSQSQGQSGGSAQANAQGQGNGQQGGRKVSGGDAVLNHAGPSDQRGDDAQDGVRRARYA